MDHMLGNKMALINLRKLKPYPPIFLIMMLRLEINYKKNIKNRNIWQLNNMLLNNQWITEEIKEKIKKKYRQMKMKVQWSKQEEWSRNKKNLN